MHYEFQIFIPKPKTRLFTPNTIIYTLHFSCVAIFIIAALTHYYPQKVFFIFIAPFSLSLLFYIRKFWRYQFLNGELTSSLIISLDHIQVAQQSFAIEEIKKMDFHFRNYYGKKEDYRNNFNPILSQGTSNFIELNLNNGQKLKTYFKLNFKSHHELLYPFIIEMVKADRISVLRGTEILGINDYDEIQEFKRKHLK